MNTPEIKPIVIVNERKSIAMHDLLSNEINATIEYAVGSKNGDNNDHLELHKALLEMYNTLPDQLEQRLAFLDIASGEDINRTESQCDNEKENTDERQ